ncbi:MAG: hypothetical protein H6767_00260 [Candidatus Peribacteria bacterium]|nr:MAG: hypothetical protein H6767_00260 [Candidatus Peribacteria bacterium]
MKELPISEVTTVIKRQLDLDNITSGDLSTWMRKKFRWILRNPLEIAHTSHTAKRLKAKKSPANKIKAKEKEERIAECIQTIK